MNGIVERFGQVARELCLRLLVVIGRLASIEPGNGRKRGPRSVASPPCRVTGKRLLGETLSDA